MFVIFSFLSQCFCTAGSSALCHYSVSIKRSTGELLAFTAMKLSQFLVSLLQHVTKTYLSAPLFRSPRSSQRMTLMHSKGIYSDVAPERACSSIKLYERVKAINSLEGWPAEADGPAPVDCRQPAPSSCLLNSFLCSDRLFPPRPLPRLQGLLDIALVHRQARHLHEILSQQPVPVRPRSLHVVRIAIPESVGVGCRARVWQLG